MTSEKVKTILSRQGIASAQNELAFFFRRICSDLRWDPIRWESKLQRMLDRNKKLIGTSTKERSYARGNMNAQFTADKLTWRTFMDALRFLGPRGAKLYIELEWAGNRRTQHAIRLNLRQEATPADAADEMEMLEEADPSLILSAPEPLSVDESIEKASEPTVLPPAPPSLTVEEQLARRVNELQQARSRLRESVSRLSDDDEAPTDDSDDPDEE